MLRRAAAMFAATLLIGAISLAAAEPAAAQEPTEPQPEPPYPSAEWTARELANFARVSQAPTQQASDPAFLQRLEEQSRANFIAFTQRQVADPDWRTTGNLCEQYGMQCAGDPYRYPGVDPFYDTAVVEAVAFLDRGGARLAGQVWAPADGDGLPGVVITNGSVQAPQTLYWWAAQALVEAGYVVLTFDPRGQGQSDNATSEGERGTNLNPDVFATNTIDAVDFFRSTPNAPYAPNTGDPRATTEYNPLWDRIDPDRLGLAGHSLGAQGVTVVQGIEPWPGDAGDPDGGNPVDAIVAWDNLGAVAGSEGLAGYPITPRVPAMGQSADYFLVPTAYTEPPDPDDKRLAFLDWQAAGVPTYQLVIEGGSHYEWSLIPTFPTSSWEPGGDSGWGRPLAEHYTLAWFDRWLKAPGDAGYDTADARLLDDDAAGPGGPSWRQRLSFYYHSSRDYPDRSGTAQVCEDIRVGCEVAAAPYPPDPTSGENGSPGDTAAPAPTGADPVLPATGGDNMPTTVAVMLVAATLLRPRRVRSRRVP